MRFCAFYQRCDVAVPRARSSARARLLLQNTVLPPGSGQGASVATLMRCPSPCCCRRRVSRSLGVKPFGVFAGPPPPPGPVLLPPRLRVADEGRVGPQVTEVVMEVLGAGARRSVGVVAPGHGTVQGWPAARQPLQAHMRESKRGGGGGGSRARPRHLCLSAATCGTILDVFAGESR